MKERTRKPPCRLCERVRRVLPYPARERLQRLEQRLKRAVVEPAERK